MSELDDAILKGRRAIGKDKLPAVLGDGNGQPRAGNGLYYVRKILAAGALSQPFKLPLAPGFNVTVADGTPVELGYDSHGNACIYPRDSQGMQAAGVSPYYGNALEQAVYHYLDPGQLPHFLCKRHGDVTNNPWTVVVFVPMVFIDPTMTAANILGIDFSSPSDIRPASGTHCYAVVCWKTNNTLEAIASTAKSTGDPLVTADIDEGLAGRSAGALPVWAWELDGDASVLSPDPKKNVDLRQWINTQDGGITLPIQTSDVLLPKVASPSITTLEQDITTRGSSGVYDGTLTYVTPDAGAGTHHIQVAAGTGYIRTSNDQQAQLVLCSWSAVTAIDIPAPAAGLETARFVGVEYNSGTPRVTVRTSFNWNWYTDFPLARVSYDGTTLRILNAYAHTEDTANLTRRWMRLIMGFIRENPPEGTGGIELSEVATRQIAVTAGNMWLGFNQYVLNAVTAGTAFDTHWRNGSGGFNNATGVTQYPNTQYDNGTGTLATMTANRYACLWVYMDVSDGSLDVMYGRNQYTSVSNAQAEAIPTTPAHLTYHGRLIARIIFQKSASAASLIESAWSTLFNPNPSISHNDLGGLQGGAAGEYYHLTSAEYTTLQAHYYETMQQAEVDQTQRGKLDFVTAALTDDSANNRTKVYTPKYTGNLLLNPSFERWAGGTNRDPNSWYSASNLASQEATIIHHGLYSCKFSGAATQYVRQYIWSVGGSTGMRGNTYTFAAWVYSANASAVRLKINDSVNSATSAAHPGDSAWHLLTVSITVDNAATLIYVQLECYSGSATAYIDQAMFIEADAVAAGMFGYQPSIVSVLKDDGGDVMECRLSLASGTPIMTADYANVTTLYWTPYLGNKVTLPAEEASTSGYEKFEMIADSTLDISALVPGYTYDVVGQMFNAVPLLDTVIWNAPTNGSITSISNASPPRVTTGANHTLTTGQIVIQQGNSVSANNGKFRVSVVDTTHYDMKNMDNTNPAAPGSVGTGGTFVRWDQTPTRANAAQYLRGRLTSAQKRLLGTIKIDVGGGVSWNSQHRGLCNFFNTYAYELHVDNDTTSNYDYATSTIRAAHDNFAQRVEVVVTYSGKLVRVLNKGGVSLPAAATTSGSILIGVDATSSFVGYGGYGRAVNVASETVIADLTASYKGQLTAGSHFIHRLETRETGTVTFLGDVANVRAYGLSVEVEL